jgi:hypothetical protein
VRTDNSRCQVSRRRDPPPPISLQEAGRFRVYLEDVSGVSERRQLPTSERVSQKSRATKQFIIAPRSRSTPAASTTSRYARICCRRRSQPVGFGLRPRLTWSTPAASKSADFGLPNQFKIELAG